jgi:hypothetical protein
MMRDLPAAINFIQQKLYNSVPKMVNGRDRNNKEGG